MHSASKDNKICLPTDCKLSLLLSSPHHNTASMIFLLSPVPSSSWSAPQQLDESKTRALCALVEQGHLTWHGCQALTRGERWSPALETTSHWMLSCWVYLPQLTLPWAQGLDQTIQGVLPPSATPLLCEMPPGNVSALLQNRQAS